MESLKIKHSYFEQDRDDAEQMWNGFAWGLPHKFATYFDDFFFFDVQHWIQHNITHTGTAIVTDAVGGQLLITNAGADDDGLVLQLGTVNAATGEGFLPAAGKRMWFETRLQANSATQSDIIAGFCVADTTAMSNANSIVFQKDDGDTNLDIKATATTLQGEAVVCTFAASTWYRLGFKVTGTNLVEYYLNGVYVGELAVPLPQTEMKLTLGIQNGEGSASTMLVDYVFAVQER